MEEVRLDSASERHLTVAALTDVGCVRDNNEDSHCVSLDESALGSLLVVADGMGGAAAGEVASGMAVEVVVSEYRDSEERGTVVENLASAVANANLAIYRRAAENRELGGMGTTCTAVALVGEGAHVAHVGDSRAYLIEDGHLHQLTRDHSLAAEYERMGGVGGAPARARNVLTRCLGVKAEVPIDVSDSPVPLKPGSRLVLCSDGLTNLVEDGEILQLATMHGPDAACRRLVQLALERGAPDNVTVVVARVSGPPAEPGAPDSD